MYIIAFASFFIPSGYAVPNAVLSAWRAFAICVSAIGTILYLSRGKASLRWVIFSLYVISYYILSKLINKSDGSMQLALLNAITVCGFVALLEHGMSTNPKQFIRLFIIGGMIVCMWHYYTFLKYRHIPGGMRGSDAFRFGETVDGGGTWFLLKHDNGSVFYFMPVLIALWFYYFEYQRGRIVVAIFTALTLYMYWSQWAVAAMLVTTGFIVVCVGLSLTKRDSFMPPFRYRGALIIGFAICIILILMSTGDIANLISEYFNKKGGFNGRGAIWDRALTRVSKHIIFGVGYESDEISKMYLHINHCHNIVVQILYTGGIVTSAIFVAALFAYDNKNYVGNVSKSSLALIASIIMMFLASAIDFYPYIPLQFVPYILYAYTKEAEQKESYLTDI